MHTMEFDQDEDGWDIVRCDCGWVSPPCPGKEEAAGFWGDHRATRARQETP